jgi:hypothetical protein
MFLQEDKNMDMTDLKNRLTELWNHHASGLHGG